MKTGLSQIMKTKLSPLSFGHLPFSQREEKKAFTLVELIVVITILAILATIAFVSIQSYTVYARDSVRLSNLRTIESSLKIQYTQGGSYAVPDDSVNITASGTVIRKQGVFGKQALRTVKLNSDASEDPLTGESYDYIVDNNLSEYQLVGYMEGDEAYHNTLQAETFANTGSTLKTLGQDLGIVFSGGIAVHKTGTDVDIRQPTSELTIVFDEDDEITSSSGSELFSNVYNRSKALLKNKELAKLDESLVLYFDMETTTMSGSLKVLKDFSMYSNNGSCYNNGSMYDGSRIIEENVSDCGIGDNLFIFGEGKKVFSLNGSTRNGLFINGTGSIDDYTVISRIRIDKLTLGDLNHGSLIGGYDCSSGGVGNPGKMSVEIIIGGEWRSDDDYYQIGLGRCSDFSTYYLWDQGFRKGEWVTIGVSVKKDEFVRYFTDSSIFNTEDTGLISNDLKIYYPFQIPGIRNTFGALGEYKIYNRALSEKEIKTIYGSTIN